MKDKIDVIIDTILEAADFLVKQSKKTPLEGYANLFNDIENGIAAINSKMKQLYGANPDFSMEKFTQELNGNLSDGTLPQELARWADKTREIKQYSNQTQKTIPTNAVTITPIDRDFAILMHNIRSKTETELKQIIKENLYSFRMKDKHNYTNTIEYYNKYKLWGNIYPERGVYDLIENRANALAEHVSDFEWLYTRLCDNKSKKILLNILTYWITFDWSKIHDIVDNTFHQYFDLDLLCCDKNEVFVDIGGFVGDTLADYVNTFGNDCYRRYYCYEILPSNLKRIKTLVDNNHLKNVEICGRGASNQSGIMFTQDVDGSSVGQLSNNGEVEVQTVAIDDDINEPVTFLKMDIEGAEENALLGCRKKIAESHPKLSLSVYHNHKDLWRLARIVSEVDPTYRFYLRYYGGSLSPTEYLLYGI